MERRWPGRRPFSGRGDGPLPPAPDRLTVALAAAHRHSRLVHVLRRALPGVAVLAFLSYFAFASLGFTSGNLTARIAGVQLSSDRLTMINPQLEGVTDEGGSYTVRAERAIQNLAVPDVIELERIDARMTEADGGWMTLQATAGTFNTKKERLDMRDGITIGNDEGMRGTMERAEVLMRFEMVRTDRPVHFEMLNGDVAAQRMTIRGKDRTISFLGRVKVNIRKRPEASPTGAAPAAAAVVSTNGG